MFEEINITPLLKIYEKVRVLEIKVLCPELKKMYIEKANEFNKKTIDDPVNAYKNNKFYFYLTNDAILSKNNYTPYTLDIQLKNYVITDSKIIYCSTINFYLCNDGRDYLHMLDQRNNYNISGVFYYYGDDEIKLPKGHSSFYNKPVTNCPLYVKIVDNFSIDKSSDLLTGGYHRGFVQNGINY